MTNRTLFAVVLLAAMAASHELQAQCQLYPNGQCVVSVSRSAGPCPRRQPVQVTSSDRFANVIRPSQKTCRKQDATPIQFECK
jgi:hypothetical protein